MLAQVGGPIVIRAGVLRPGLVRTTLQSGATVDEEDKEEFISSAVRQMKMEEVLRGEQEQRARRRLSCVSAPVCVSGRKINRHAVASSLSDETSSVCTRAKGATRVSCLPSLIAASGAASARKQRRGKSLKEAKGVHPELAEILTLALALALALALTLTLTQVHPELAEITTVPTYLLTYLPTYLLTYLSRYTPSSRRSPRYPRARSMLSSRH